MSTTETPTTAVNVNQAVTTNVVIARNGLATAALILGLCTFVTFGATGIPALICGILGYREARQSNVGEGSALTGIILGGLAVFGWLCFWGLAALGSVLPQ